MTVKKSQIEATTRYNKNKYDAISIRIPKGKKEKYKRLADAVGVSLAGLVQKILDAECEKNGIE